MGPPRPKDDGSIYEMASSKIPRKTNLIKNVINGEAQGPPLHPPSPVAIAEDVGAHPHHGGALLYRYLQVGAHPHGELGKR